MRRIPELDSLRGLAALAIVAFHLNPPAFFPGWTGVDLFFVLSGYLITGIILRHGHSRGFLATFYIRRGLRIWPIYYLTLGVLVLAIRRMPNPLPLDALPYYLTYTQNVRLYWGNTAPSIAPFDHTWTLALEEQFYLIWPALLLLAGPRRVVPVCLATVAASVMARDRFELLWEPFSPRTLLGRCDGFALGGLLAAVLLWADQEKPPGIEDLIGRSPWRTGRRALVLAGLGWLFAGSLGAIAWGGYSSNGLIYFLGMPTPRHPSTTILAVSVLYASIVGLVAMRAGRRELVPLRFAPLAYLGKISYGLYLYHYPIFWAVDGYRFVYVQPWSVRLVKLGLTLAAGVLSWHLIESPILRLKDRFGYRSGAPGGHCPSGPPAAPADPPR